jgi:pimeloyl-ACP methyl ester carboxylesterase
MPASHASSHAVKSTTGRATDPHPLALQAVRGGFGVLSRVSPAGAAVVAERLFLSPRRWKRPDAERELLARARRLELPTANGKLRAWEWSPAEAHAAALRAPRVLLVHGWEGRGAQLGAFVDPLVALDFRVVTFDAPAHGDSPGDRSSLFHFADAVTRARDAFGPFHAIVTHSMGGAATLWANRHGPLAVRIVMVAPPIDLRDFTRVFSRMLGLPEEVRARVHERLAARFGVPLAEVQAEAVARTMRVPALVVHDEDDRDVPVACGEAIARAWPGAELVKTKGLGHTRILRDPHTRDLVVRFVSQPPAA